VRGDLIAHRFTDEETRRIFERAAEAETRPQTSSSRDGHTLEELRAIASEVGLDSAAVERAAAEIIASDVSVSERGHHRFSTLLHEDAVISRPLSTDEMRKLTSQVEQIIGRRGLVSDAGPWVEWRDSKDRLYVGMIRGDKQTRIRAIANQSGEMVVGSAAIGVLGFLLLPGASGSGWLNVAVVLAATLGLIGVFLRHRVAVGRRELRELLDILKDVADR
jgi:hypothetical protein